MMTWTATLAPKATDNTSGYTTVYVARAFTDVRTRHAVAVLAPIGGTTRTVPLARVTLADAQPRTEVLDLVNYLTHASGDVDDLARAATLMAQYAVTEAELADRYAHTRLYA